MKIEDLICLINKHHRTDGECSLDFPCIVSELPKGLEEQRSDIEGVDKEWVKQYVDQFDNYSGTIAYKLDDGTFLTFFFCG